uniref:ATP synthase F0 subunit 8 n=1 Tax=Junceella fragilis TaxID=98366 RepID=A0A059VAQ7_9CNID|nr:ATP synthase F0 subunit 8 [Junceella fragilis]YP_010322878.1 ATP synthase F0 subunit 8 [Dichotella gemmacea]AHZ88974.1 ATP synthase F0 subunit 8 [Junceella fragilis]UKP87566.1 ATP synthase F0 subunit 8 [Dichotella gemmacea]
MPHLDITAYLTQYSWTLITLLALYSIMSLYILPKIQNNLRIRSILQEEGASLSKGLGVNKAYTILQDILHR